MTGPIRICGTDSEEEVKRRHERVVARLDELGMPEVRAMFARDDFPHPWHPIIHEWLRSRD